MFTSVWSCLLVICLIFWLCTMIDREIFLMQILMKSCHPHVLLLARSDCLYFSDSLFLPLLNWCNVCLFVQQKEPSSDVSSPSSPRLAPPSKRTRRQTASEPSSSDTSPSPQTKGQRVSWDIPTYRTRSAAGLCFTHHKYLRMTETMHVIVQHNDRLVHYYICL